MSIEEVLPLLGSHQTHRTRSSSRRHVDPARWSRVLVLEGRRESALGPAFTKQC